MNPKSSLAMKILPLALLPVLLSATACFAPTVDITPRFGEFDVEGDFAASVAGGGATANSSFESMGLDDSEATFVPRGDLSWAGMHLSVTALDADFAGTGVVDNTIVYEGTTITGGTMVDSEFKFSTLSSALTWDLIPSDTIEVGIGIGVSLMDIDLSIQEIGGALNEISTDEVIPIPMVALRAEFELGPIGVTGTANMIEVGTDDGDVSVTDLDINGAYRLFGGKDRARGSAVLGWRSFEVDVEYSDDDDDINANWTIDGFYLGLQFSF
jgi:hypothetical protein